MLIVVALVAVVVVDVVIVEYIRFVVRVNKIVFKFWVPMKNNMLITERQIKDYRICIYVCGAKPTRIECISWREHTHTTTTTTHI